MVAVTAGFDWTHGTAPGSAFATPSQGGGGGGGCGGCGGGGGGGGGSSSSSSSLPVNLLCEVMAQNFVF